MQIKLHIEDADEVGATGQAITLGVEAVIFLPNGYEQRVAVCDALLDKLVQIRQATREAQVLSGRSV